MARKVLVADDSVTIQKVVGLTFANEDIELSFVDNGEEAVSLAKRIKPDLIMADVLMPGKSGYEVCESVKSDPELQHIPVLLLTGTFEPFDADRCARAGADGTITKPFESQTLIQEVRELLDRPSGTRAPLQAPAIDPVDELAQEAPASASPPPPGDPLAEEPAVPAADSEDRPEAGPAFADLEFTTDPESALARESIDAPQTPSEGAPASWSEAPGAEASDHVTQSPEAAGAPEPPAPEGSATVTPADEDVWDLSDFEAVDESQVEPLPEDATVEESDALWNEAAAEAIDLVESTNLEADNEDPSADSPVEGAAAPETVSAIPDAGTSAPDGDFEPEEDFGMGVVEGESKFEALDLGPDSQDSSLDIDASGSGAVEAPREIATPLDDPPFSDATPEDDFSSLSPENLDEDNLEEVAVEALPERGADAAAPEPGPPAAEAPASADAAPDLTESLSALSGLPADKSAAIVREAVKDAVEKVTWEAFGDLSDTVVRAVQEKVEKIAWEVIPEMAESIIKEEIKRLKDGDE